MLRLYSTGCPRCMVLEKKLDDAGLIYEKITDVNTLLEKNFMSVPMLEADYVLMDFKKAVDWINERTNNAD